MPALRAATLLVIILCSPAASARAAELADLLGTIRWGESSAEITRALGARALQLNPPIEFGDSLVDVALRDFTFGGYRFVVYFQMDKTSHGLKRVMLERQRHGANPMVYRAVVNALQHDYGAPVSACAAQPGRKNGYQAAVERVWQGDGVTIHAILRDTTMEASESCFRAVIAACGLTGHLFVQITPRTAGAPACG